MRVTDTMEAFVRGESATFLDDCASRLQSQWYQFGNGALASTFSLIWAGLQPTWTKSADDLISKLIGGGSVFDGCRLEKWNACAGAGGTVSRSFKKATLIECDFDGLALGGSSFEEAWLESISFAGCDLSGALFQRANILDVDMTGTKLAGCDFRGADDSMSIRVDSREIEGAAALGYLRFQGAITPDVDPIHIAKANPDYEIYVKIARELLKPGPSQVLGLTKRGVSAKNPAVAQEFVELLGAVGYARFDKSGSAPTAEVTRDGRAPLMKLADETELDATIAGRLLPSTSI